MQPPSGGCVLKPTGVWFDIISLLAATFGWLCVETNTPLFKIHKVKKQPPSGGCVLKLYSILKVANIRLQPPSGGCVLKRRVRLPYWHDYEAATFGWLCVET